MTEEYATRDFYNAVYLFTKLNVIPRVENHISPGGTKKMTWFFFPDMERCHKVLSEKPIEFKEYVEAVKVIRDLIR